MSRKKECKKTVSYYYCVKSFDFLMSYSINIMLHEKLLSCSRTIRHSYCAALWVPFTMHFFDIRALQTGMQKNVEFNTHTIRIGSYDHAVNFNVFLVVRQGKG